MLGSGCYNIFGNNPFGHHCPHVALPPWEEVGSEGISVGEVVAGAVSGKYLSICPAQHESRFFEINWTTYLLKIT